MAHDNGMDMGKLYPNERKWMVVYDEGVGWRSSPKYDDRAVGKGPNVGDVFETVGGPIQGDKCWFIKVAQGGMFLFLPCDTGRYPARPVVRPYVDIPSYSDVATWRVVFPNGTGTRKSNLYDDRDDHDDGKTPYYTLEAGETFQGRACQGAFGGPEMVKITSAKNGQLNEPKIHFVPITTKDGRPVCEKIGGAPQSGHSGPAPSPYGAPAAPGFAPVGPPSGYPAAPPSGYPAAPASQPSYGIQMMRQQNGYGAPVAAAAAAGAAAGAIVDAQGDRWTTHQSNGRTYWANTRTGQTSWNNPAPPQAAPASQPQSYGIQMMRQQNGYGAPQSAPVSAPQPPAPPAAAGGWTRYQAPDGRPYWSNGRDTTWNDPTEWQELSSQGRPYYHNKRTGETKWEKPW